MGRSIEWGAVESYESVLPPAIVRAIQAKDFAPVRAYRADLDSQEQRWEDLLLQWRINSMDDKIKRIVSLIEASDLDKTIKDILIRDLRADGLTDFLCEQIKVYCAEALKRIQAHKQEIDSILANQDQKPAA